MRPVCLSLVADDMTTVTVIDIITLASTFFSQLCASRRITCGDLQHDGEIVHI